METPDTFLGLFWAYFSFWLILSAYLLSLGCRISKLEKQKNSNGE